MEIIDKIKFLLGESVFSHGYSDSELAGDDDFPTGNILMGDRYKMVNYYNRLTQFNVNWVPDLSKWTWDVFGGATGQESKDTYHDTLKNFALTDRLFAHMTNKPPKPVPKWARAIGNDIFPDTDAWGKKQDYQMGADIHDIEPEDRISKNKVDKNDLVDKYLKKSGAESEQITTKGK